ncbi:MAG: protein kinase domain-containing protein [Bryobacteraceae bacterium]
MVCPGCNADNPDNVRFCHQCGRSLQAADDAQTVMLGGSTTGFGPPQGASQSATWAMPAASGARPVMPTNLAPGTAFGSRYRIEALLGDGGMGAVYKAYDTELGRTVALKLVRPELATSPQTMQRFKQELLLASKISHKNILRIHDLGDAGGVKFITMALVEGTDLSGLIEKNGRLPFDRAMKYTRQLCSALEAAHNEGVVHRDLKPQNILIDQADNIYVSDFGLAKSLESEATMMTRTGQILGTPRYMSPEQVEAREVDHRADIYSMGLIIYEMFTADIPFRGESAMQLMYQRVTAAPQDPRTIFPEMPDYLANIILKCLERDPAKRYQSAREVLDDLDAQNIPALSPSATTTTTTATATTTSAPKPKPGSATISIEIPKPTGRWGMIMGGLALAVALIFAIPATRHLILGTAPSQPTHYIAILPVNYQGDQSFSYIGDGVGDTLAAKLAGLKNVYVSSGRSVETAATKFKDDKDKDDKIAKMLGVTILARTTVQVSGDQVSVIVSMDKVGKGGGNLIKGQKDGSRQNLITLEDEAFNVLVGGLQINRTKEELARTGARPTDSSEAYDAYLRGRNLLRVKRDPDSLKTALDFFDKAIQGDPRFALALAGRADACLFMYDATKDSSWTEKALTAAQAAEGINPSLPEVHTSLGSIYTATGKSQQAISELQQALDLVPTSDDCMRRLGVAYAAAGNQPKAIEEYLKATETNKYLWLNFNFLGGAYTSSGQYDKALAAFLQVTRLEPDIATGYANMGTVYLAQDKWSDCIGEYERAISTNPQNPLYYSNRGVAYFRLGRYPESIKDFEKAVELSPNDARMRVNLADVYRVSGQTAKAASAYDEAIKLAAKSLQVNPQDSDALGTQAIAYAKTGNQATALQLIQRARQIKRDATLLMFREATIYALAGNTAGAISSLRQALQNNYSLGEINSDPELASLRKTPEFAQLLQEFSKKAPK